MPDQSISSATRRRCAVVGALLVYLWSLFAEMRKETITTGAQPETAP